MKPGQWRGREGLETSSRRRGGGGMSWRCTRPIGRTGARCTRDLEKVRRSAFRRTAALILALARRPVARLEAGAAPRAVAAAGSVRPAVAGALRASGTLIVAGSLFVARAGT